MKTIHFFLFVLFSISANAQDSYEHLFGDSVSEIKWSCHIAYLPGGHMEHITLTATPDKLKASYRTIRWRKRYRRPVKKKIHYSKSDFTKLQARFNELNQPKISIVLSEEDKQTLRKIAKYTLYNGSFIYQLSAEQLEQYLVHDTLIIDPSVFEIDSLNFSFHGMVIDGAPFSINYTTIEKENDTTILNYSGNLAGGTGRFRDLDTYIRFNLLVNSTHLFDRLPLENYFSRKRLLNSVLLYLEGKEGLLEFKPLELLFKEE